MKWNGFLADALLWQLLLLPAVLVAAKIGFPQLRWWVVVLLAAALGWLVQQAFFWAYPPEMGLADAAALMFGWITALPVVAALAPLWLIKRWRGTRPPQIAAGLLLTLAIALPAIACFRWIPEEEAKALAADRLREVRQVPFTFTEAERTWDGWTIHADVGGSDYPVYLSRSGAWLGNGGG